MRVIDAFKEIEKVRATEDIKNRDFGTAFEHLFCEVAKRSPELEVDTIYPIAKWPEAGQMGLDGRDIGVDLVTTLKDGKRVAIQCKAHKENLGKENIQDLLASMHGFDMGWLVTTSDLTDNAKQLCINANVKIIHFQQFHDLELAGDAPARHKPWDLQQKAIDAVVTGFDEMTLPSKRGHLVMACGTGKTFTSLCIAERLVQDEGIILFIAPSISLISQARKEWLQQSEKNLLCTVICSDKTVTNPDDKHRLRQILSELSCGVTTNPQEIAEAIKKNQKLLDTGKKQGVQVVFSTYQSLDKLCAAQKDFNLPEFDLAIIDEAHRTAGVKEVAKIKQSQLIHDNDNIKCDKRLYMTATPKIYGGSDKKAFSMQALRKGLSLKVTDMNDQKTFGPRFATITFRQAVDKGRLANIKVIAVGLNEGLLAPEITERLKKLSNQTDGHGGPPDQQEYTSAMLIYKAIIKNAEREPKDQLFPPLHRTITYANTLRKSRWFEKAIRDFNSGALKERMHVEGEYEEIPVVEAKHLEAKDTAGTREIELDKLKRAEEDNVSRIITNVGLFSEGVNVPTLSSIAFLNGRDSEIDIIQAIGRVMRKPKGTNKQYGYVIAPFYLERDESVAEALENKSPRFAILGKVLRALYAHDPDFDMKLGKGLIMQFLLPDNTSGKSRGEAGEGNGGGAGGDGNFAEDDSIQPELFGFQNWDGFYPLLANYIGVGNPGRQVADDIIVSVKYAAKILQEEKVDRTLANVLGSSDELLDSITEEELKSKFVDATNTAALILINACLMHKRLSKSSTWDGKKFTELDALAGKDQIIPTLIESWETILIHDYKPIFEQALGILRELDKKHSDIVNLKIAISTLITRAVDTADKLNDLGYDHAGPLYHKILDKASNQGAFYTHNISAVLLAKLLFNNDFIDWEDTKKVKDLKILDPSCGTGTLLMAALNIIKKKCGDVKDLHKDLVENSIFGFDITPQAVQLAACNLTLGDPNVLYSSMGVYTLPYGHQSQERVNQDSVRQGAIELLHQKHQNVTSGHQLSVDADLDLPISGISVEEEQEGLKDLGRSFDAIIMNPPFTDLVKQKGQFSKVVGDAMSERLKNIKKELREITEDGFDIPKNTIQPFFNIIAEALLKQEGGILGEVLPTTICTAENAIGQRRFLAQNFHIERIVTMHDPKEKAFAGDNPINQSLLIARRKAKLTPPPPPPPPNKICSASTHAQNPHRGRGRGRPYQFGELRGLGQYH